MEVGEELVLFGVLEQYFGKATGFGGLPWFLLGVGVAGFADS
jgi:hypothetical protein